MCKFFSSLAAGLALGSFAQAAVLLPRATTPGCGHTHTATGQTTQFSLVSSGVTREFLVWIPTNYDTNLAHSMVLSFHGNGKDMNSQATLSRFTDSTINPHMIAVFPNGQPGSDNGELCWEGAPYCSNPASDKVFVTDLLNYMRNNYCVDNTRIYASGKSNGGGFVDVLACSPDHGADFAAFAMDAAALYNEADGSGCTPARSPMPILELHGTADTTIPYNGGTSHDAPLPNVRSVLSTWATRNGCTGNPPVPKVDSLQANGQGSWDYTQYDCQGIPSMVVGYHVTGQEHWWISTQSNADNNGDVAPIDASTLMMTFFNNNYKPS